MLMVVFGAGASWDSANFEPTDVTTTMHWRPPIGSELFADRRYFGLFIDKYWWVRPLVNRFRNARDSVTLEAELEEIQDASKGRVLTREQLFALRYYLQRVISGTCQEWSNRIHGNTNYVRLVDDVDSIWTHGRKGDPVIFVTFNYDVLLDGALGQIDVKVGESLESYTENPQYRLIKPHGSVNWFHKVPVPNRSAHPYYMQIVPGLAKEELKAADGFFIAPEGSDIDDIDGIPALSIPVAKKTNFEMPREHLAVLKEAIPQVTHLLIIGWRGNEQHFVALLRALDRERLASLVVSGHVSSAKEVATALDLDNIPPHLSAGGFSTFLGGAELRDFLRR
jgi:SIR2-like protein